MGRMRITTDHVEAALRSGGRTSVQAALRTTHGKNALRRIQGEPAVIANVKAATGKTPSQFLKN